MRTLPLLLLASSLAASGSTQAAMPLAPTVVVRQPGAARPAVAVSDQVVSERRAGREDPHWIGTIRGGYGNPLKRLVSDQPVDRVVPRAFADGLAARGLGALGGAPPYSLAVAIRRFDANRYVRREATADFSAVLTERATGREVWRDRHRAHNVDGGIIALDIGVFGSTDDLRRVALRTMSEAVDGLLDKPGLRAALRRG